MLVNYWAAAAWSMRAFIVLLLILLAGCSAPTDPGPDPDDAAASVAASVVPDPLVATKDGHHTVASVCASAADRSTMAGTFTRALQFRVPDGSKHLVMETKWDGAVATGCLVYTDAADDVVIVEATREQVVAKAMAIRLDAPAAGTWFANFIPEGAADVDFLVAASMFQGDVPDEYSAW